MTRILIVEDSPTQAQRLQLVLESENIIVAAAPNAETALQYLQRESFDMVISDIVMPGISGYELCRRIKQGPGGRDLPVILLSTLSDPMDIIRGLECEADNFITKPYETEQLIARVRTVLENKDARSRGKLAFGVEVIFLGKKFVISSEKEQILDLLISTFEDIVRTNRGLQQSKAELAAAKEEIEAYAHDLERRVRERTAELFEQQRQLAQAQAIAHVGNWSVALGTNSLQWSDEMYWIFGLDRSRPPQTLESMLALADADDRSSLSEIVKQSIIEKSSFRHEFRIVRPQGERRHCWIEGHCQLGERGEVVALFGVCQDVTERKTAEERAQQLQAEFLHVSRLSDMGQMGSTLAHELNQPLAAINNYVHASRRLLAGDSAARDRVPAVLEKVAEQSSRASAIIRRLRDFVSKGQTDHRPEILTEVIEEANALVMTGLPRNDVRVRFDFDTRVHAALIDRIQIQQVLVNLMRNAMEAMAESERRELTITTVRSEDAFVEIRIADTGPGLAAEVAERLFKPFVTTKSNGMGVGLSICQSIVEAHGGMIGAGPVPGGGTIFRFTVPVAPAEASRLRDSHTSKLETSFPGNANKL
jgi:two-component system sensor kinase FixL